MFKNNLRLLIEFIVIISGVLLSFYIDDFRQLQNQKLEKDILIGELVITAREDLKQIQNLKKDLINVKRFRADPYFPKNITSFSVIDKQTQPFELQAVGLCLIF